MTLRILLWTLRPNRGASGKRWSTRKRSRCQPAGTGWNGLSILLWRSPRLSCSCSLYREHILERDRALNILSRKHSVLLPIDKNAESGHGRSLRVQGGVRSSGLEDQRHGCARHQRTRSRTQAPDSRSGGVGGCKYAGIIVAGALWGCRSHGRGL